MRSCALFSLRTKVPFVALRRFAAFGCVMLGVSAAHGETRINQPGSVLAGAMICDALDCSYTAHHKVTPATIVSYDPEKGTDVLIKGARYTVVGNEVAIHYKGCHMSIDAYLSRTFCAANFDPEEYGASESMGSEKMLQSPLKMSQEKPGR